MFIQGIATADSAAGFLSCTCGTPDPHSFSTQSTTAHSFSNEIFTGPANGGDFRELHLLLLNLYDIRFLDSTEGVGGRDCEHGGLSGVCLCGRPARDQTSTEEGAMTLLPILPLVPAGCLIALSYEREIDLDQVEDARVLLKMLPDSTLLHVVPAKPVPRLIMNFDFCTVALDRAEFCPPLELEGFNPLGIAFRPLLGAALCYLALHRGSPSPLSANGNT